MTPLPAGPESRIDRATVLRVNLDQGALSSLTTQSMLAGGNVAAIRNAVGVWEVIQFETATLVAPATYELRNLLRGQGGSEEAMFETVAPDARFVLLDQAVARIDLTQNQIGLPFNWRYGPANRDLGDPDYRTGQHAFGAVGLRPLSPVHVRGRRSGNDLALTWIRRTREGGDGWIAAEVPLAEESERYEVDILASATVKRTLVATSSTIAYTATDQIADFGAPQQQVSLRIYQISAFAGRGTGRAATV